MKSCLKYFILLLCLKFIEGAFRCDYKYSVATSAWFKYHIVPMTWSDARLRCALEGATLASPTTREIRSEMVQILKDSTSKREIFTGIHATLASGDHNTVEGIPLSNIPAIQPTVWITELKNATSSMQSHGTSLEPPSHAQLKAAILLS
ncbi:hypothetical protein PYW07_009921 [Mythimna separata]|uniref:C-type lectin domain-containing protein n=1 Tax=Mythimna separata TaxID=271217 RepID=A0AAD7YI63_MYTSE|nr:hypothetical protein PYW07_009921 [Mythimna separata]